MEREEAVMQPHIDAHLFFIIAHSKINAAFLLDAAG